MSKEHIGPWQYESDGEIHAHTHYLHRDNSTFPLGVERRDFRTKADALRALKTLRNELMPSSAE